MPQDTSSLEARIEELEKADRAKDQYLALLSHEVRNHIHAIRTNVWLIKARHRDPEIARPSDAIDRQVGKLAHLVEELLDSIRATNRSNLAFGSTMLQQVVQGAIESTKATLDMHRRELTVEMPDKPIYVNADAPRLQQVVMQLLRNAIQYSSQQDPVTILVRREAGDAVLCVKDQGRGIEAAALSRLFHAFDNGTPARKDGSAGLGIGLHVSRELIQAHGGTIEAKSDGAGKGAEFIVRLPTVESPDEAEEVMPEPSRTNGGLSILVVDDNQDAADSLAEVLQAYGHRVTAAYGGEEALQVASKGGVQVALVDIGMPTVDGFQVARSISQSPVGRETLLVAVTGWGEKADRERSKEAGFAYHLTKPVDFDALASLLSTAARRAQAVRA
jgi:CheY-like chemotaxis protein